MTRLDAPSIECPYCQRQAPRVTGREIYPHRADLYAKRFFRCSPCNAWVGCHPDGRPLGRLANAELRKAKQYVHERFDPLWRDSNKAARKHAYKWLADHMGIPTSECHIGMFDIDTCRRAYRILLDEAPTAATIKVWRKERAA